MKKIILTIAAAGLLTLSHAQQRGNAKNTRERLSEINAITDPKQLDRTLKELLSGTNEEDYLLAYSYYTSKREEDKVSTTKDLILKKFPEGQLAVQEKIQAISGITDLGEKDKRFMELYAKHPDAGYAFTAMFIAQEFAAKGDEAKMKFYADIYAKGVTDGQGNKIPIERAYASVAGPMIRSNPDVAAKYLKAGVDYAKTSVDEMLTSEKPDENLLQRAKSNYYSVLSSYTNALALGSNPESAFQFIGTIYADLIADSKSERHLANVEAAYLLSLVKTSRFKEAQPLLEKTFIVGELAPEMKANLKEAYMAVHGSDTNFAKYENDLLAKQVLRQQAEVAKKSVNEASHDFTLKDVDGNTVKLSDLRGKVVVLDFWATWCGPCKASFPGMQQAVNKYKDDPNVKFLFLHTWEKGSGDPIAGAKKYVTDNNYSFQVLMDLRNPENNQSAVASAYKVTGIPTKIIIDPNGQVRFNTSGGGADVDKIVNELSAMIEFARKG